MGMKVAGMKHLILLLILSACGASPAPQFFGAIRHEVTLSGINFVVFQKDDRAEVVRLGYLTRAERAAGARSDDPGRRTNHRLPRGYGLDGDRPAGRYRRSTGPT